MVEQIRLFVGKNDTEELKEMAQFAKFAGFLIGDTGNDPVFCEVGYEGKEVIIQGGFTNSCLPNLVAKTLRAGTTKVTVDLEQCRGTPYFENNNNNSVQKVEMRRRQLLDELGQYGKDSRLKVLPPKKKRFGLF